MTPRLVISVVALSLATLLLVYNPTTNGDQIATTIIGAILGYWLNHGERVVTHQLNGNNKTGQGGKT